MSASATPRPLSTRVFGVLVGILVVLLPALVAASGLDRPATAAERDRLGEAIAVHDGERREESLAARVLYGASLPADAAQEWQRAPDATLARARTAMLACGFCVSALLYLLLSATRGGLTALLGCITLASLPAVAEDGHALRPEPLAVAFALLATVLLVALTMTQRLRRGSARARMSATVAMIVFSGAAFGLAVVAQARFGVLLLVPGGMVTLACALQTWSWVRLYRRRRLDRRVMPGLARRSWPWFLLGVVGMAVTSAVIFWLLGQGVRVPDPSGSAFGLLPESGVRRYLFVALMLLGAVRFVLEGGHQLSVRRRLSPSLVVLLFVAVTLMQYRMSGEGLDTLLPACAVAVLVGEGSMTALMLLMGVLIVRAQRRLRGG